MSGVTQLQQISEQVVARFGAAHRTLGTAESLTGGMIASSVADVSGASAVLMGGVVSYDPRVKHAVLCYGYSVEIKRSGRFSVERAKEKEIPMRLWNPLQKGNTVEYEGRVYTPDMVLGPARKGIKVTYCTDSRPLEHIVEAAEGSDLFICEGMYAEKEKIVKAKQYKHMTFYEAADMAKRAGVKELWLTHFSPSLVRAEDYMPQVRDIFANAYLGKDAKSVELMFDED